MKNLAKIKTFAMCTGILIGNITPVWAAATGIEDNSDLFVWMFLAFCALIVVAQILPATMLFLGFAKGTRTRIREAVPSRIKD